MPATTTISPFLTFDSQAEAAAQLYTSIFGGKIVDISRYGDGAPAPKGAVMTVVFELFGQRFVALNGGPHFKFSEGFSLCVTCQTQEEIDTYWSKLVADGGEEGPCGWLKDRFGVSWQVVPANIAKLISRPAAMQAMMKMKKLNIAELVGAR
jgi:predicted 3-demethylubiquinone-9 3-methyltransferase (glyoxalase superfamily)